jgi:hypothetical protein
LLLLVVVEMFVEVVTGHWLDYRRRHDPTIVFNRDARRELQASSVMISSNKH